MNTTKMKLMIVDDKWISNSKQNRTEMLLEFIKI